MEAIAGLLELRQIPLSERKARTLIKLSGMPLEKGLENFDIDWLQGGFTRKTPGELPPPACLYEKGSRDYLEPTFKNEQVLRRLCPGGLT